MIRTTIKEKKLFIPSDLLRTYAELKEMSLGRFASIRGYNTSKGEKANITIALTTPAKVNERTLEEMKKLSFNDVEITSELEGKFNEKTVATVNKKYNSNISTMEELFFLCISLKLKQMQGMSGDRTDAHRSGKDRCGIADGHIRIDFVTEKVDGLMQPVMKDGLPTIKQLRINCVQIAKKVLVEGESKKVNSGIKVLMDKVINKAMNKKSISIKTYSLFGGKFDELRIEKQTFEGKTLYDGDDLAEIKSLLGETATTV